MSRKTDIKIISIMAQIDTLTPFVLYFEAGVSKRFLSLPISDLFEEAKRTGFSNDPDDSGGATMCGVTIATYRTYRKAQGFATTTVSDLKRMTYTDWRGVFKKMFWDRWKGDQIQSQALANILVDWVWASGAYGITMPQQILGVTADGIVGVKTITALNAASPQPLFSQLHQARIDYVEGIARRNPRKGKFLKGWKRRINAITYGGLKYE